MENSSLENVRFRLKWLLSLVLRYHERNTVERAMVHYFLEALAIIPSLFNCSSDIVYKSL